MKRIATKLFLAFLCMAAAAIGILWLLQAGIMKDNYKNDRERSVDGAVQDALRATSADFAALEDSLNARFLLLDARGAVRYLSQGFPMKGMLVKELQAGQAYPADGIVRALAAPAGGQYALLGRAGEDGSRLYAVFSLADVEKASEILLNELWIVTAALVAAAFALAAILSRAFSGPVRRITGAARAMAAGQYGARAGVRSADEIGQLADALDELGAQLQKTEALRRELIANVSHELRSPLAVIRGYAETVRDVTWPQEEKRTEQLTTVAREAERLSRVVEDILDYSRLQAGVAKVSPAVFALCPALRQALPPHEPEAAAKSLRLELQCGETDIRFDEGKFAQVMDNLIRNAIHHADAGTAVEIAARRDGGTCRISVSNRGAAIPEEELPRIWERYYRAGGAGEGRPLGTGLGLAIVREILELHGRAYGVESGDGATVFWFDAETAD